MFAEECSKLNVQIGLKRASIFHPKVELIHPRLLRKMVKSDSDAGEPHLLLRKEGEPGAVRVVLGDVRCLIRVLGSIAAEGECSNERQSPMELLSSGETWIKRRSFSCRFHPVAMWYRANNSREKGM